MEGDDIMGNWIEVDKYNPCPICGKPDWCGRTADGELAVCMRIESERPMANGGWLYLLTDNFPKTQPITAIPPERRAKPELLDEVYNAMLRYLSLSSKHRNELTSPKRGMTMEQIRHRKYKSLTSERCFVDDLVTICKLEGAPGFYINGRWTLAGANGLLIPVRDVYGRIVGFQVKPDEPGESSPRGTAKGDIQRGKYLWLSSKGKSGGTGSGSPSHLATPMEQKGDRLWITEGPLKADIACDLLGEYVIGVPGVSAWRKCIYMLPKLKPSVVVLAYDMDIYNNEHVKIQCRYLSAAVAGKGYDVSVALWNKEHKGIDDILLARGEVKVKEVN